MLHQYGSCTHGPAAGRPPRHDDLRDVLTRLVRFYLPNAGVSVDRSCPRCPAQHGKPRLLLDDGRESALRLSVAHARDITVFAFSSDADVGIDVETVRDDFDWAPMLDTVFSPAEQRETEATTADDVSRRRRYYERWVAKEAVLKAIGVGVDGPIREVDTTGHHSSWDGWAVCPLRLELPTVGALACRQRPERVRIFTTSSLPA